MNWFSNWWYERQKLGGAKRSKEWSKVRYAHLKKFPACQVCGKIQNVVPHHIKPFHLFPELELEESNLISLCESSGMNCHITFGHLGNFRKYNNDVLIDVKIWNKKITDSK